MKNSEIFKFVADGFNLLSTVSQIVESWEDSEAYRKQRVREKELYALRFKFWTFGLTYLEKRRL